MDNPCACRTMPRHVARPVIWLDDVIIFGLFIIFDNNAPTDRISQGAVIRGGIETVELKPSKEELAGLENDGDLEQNDDEVQ